MNPDGPQALLFVIGWTCNARCPACIFRADLIRTKGHIQAPFAPIGVETIPRVEMNVDTFKRALSRYSTVNGVDISSIGEPTCNRDIEAILRAVPRAMTLSITSNGELLEQHLGVLSDHPGTITFSIDSPSPRRHSEIRPGIDGKKAWNTLSLAVRTRPIGRAVNVNMVVTARNVNDMALMAARCVSEGVTSLSFVRGIRLEGTSVADDAISWNDQRALAGLAKAHDHAGKRMILVDYIRYFDGGLPIAEDADGNACDTIDGWMNVTPDGRAKPCCRTYGIDLGSMIDENPWGSPKLDALRHAVRARDYSQFRECSTCPFRHGTSPRIHMR